jgi:hypothetical protein
MKGRRVDRATLARRQGGCGYRRSNYGAAQHDSGATGNPPYSTLPYSVGLAQPGWRRLSVEKDRMLQRSTG